MRMLAISTILAFGCKPGIKAFHLDPPCVCKGSEITLTWSVAHGRPEIAVDHPPEGWPGKQPFDCSESRTYRVNQSAEFIMTVAGANAANGDLRRPQSVTVVESQAPASAATPDCTETGATRAVTGPMPTVSSCGAPVTRIHDPIVQTTGDTDVVNAPRRVCLIGPDGTHVCVDPGGSVPVDAVLGTGWKIEVPLLDSEHCNGGVPGLATIQLDLDCSKLAAPKG